MIPQPGLILRLVGINVVLLLLVFLFTILGGTLGTSVVLGIALRICLGVGFGVIFVMDVDDDGDGLVVAFAFALALTSVATRGAGGGRALRGVVMDHGAEVGVTDVFGAPAVAGDGASTSCDFPARSRLYHGVIRFGKVRLRIGEEVTSSRIC